jgi:dienelactone hydrolase
MTLLKFIPCLALLTAALHAQAPAEPGPLTPDQQPETQAMATAARNLTRTSKASDEAKADAAKLIEESATVQGGETRRKLANAITLLSGGVWDAKVELAWSLGMKVDTEVADSATPIVARIVALYPASFKAAHALQVKAILVPPGSKKSDPPAMKGGRVYPVAAGSFAGEFGFDANPEGVADGAYTLRAEIMDGDQMIASLERPIQVVRGILTERQALERRLSKIQDHESTKSTIRYPYILAMTVNTGRRRLNQADFGIPFEPRPVPYDFASSVKQSAALLKALESGKDPIWQAKGDHARHYWFEEAHEMMPYRLYVPQKWDGKSKLPMVLVLHGATRDENFYFDRDGGILAKQAEQHGFLVVCPLGFRPSGEWGSAQVAFGNPATAGRGRGGNPPANGGGAGRGGGGFAGNPARATENEWSEKDGLKVRELVRKEYPIDSSRIYLFGHSRGGAGAWYLGQKYPELWAAMANSAAGISANGFRSFPYEGLKNLPFMVVCGDKDPALTATRLSVELAKEHGLDPIYVEVKDATHESIVAIEEPQVFEFFEKHRRS